MRPRSRLKPEWTLSAAILLMTVLLACGSKETQKTSEESAGDRYGGTLVVGIIGDVDALNPLVSSTRGASDIEGMIFLTLTDINKDLDTYSPALAKSWEFSEDGPTASRPPLKMSDSPSRSRLTRSSPGAPYAGSSSSGTWR
jgi:ABC-type transport system substrate-binding protein